MLSAFEMHENPLVSIRQRLLCIVVRFGKETMAGRTKDALKDLLVSAFKDEVVQVAAGEWAILGTRAANARMQIRARRSHQSARMLRCILCAANGWACTQ